MIPCPVGGSDPFRFQLDQESVSSYLEWINPWGLTADGQPLPPPGLESGYVLE